MASAHGCLKAVGIGCLGLLVLVVLGVGIPAFIAWQSLGDRQVTQRQVGPRLDGSGGAELESVAPAGSEVESAASGRAAPEAAPPLAALPAAPGRVILDLAQGEFEVRPADPGESVRVEARYDENSAVLEDDFQVLPDSTWVYRVRYRQRSRGFTGMLRALMGGNRGAYVHVFLPPDVPIALELHVSQGDCETHLGGLWLTDLDVRATQGGVMVRVKEPLHAPLEQATFKLTMGGLETKGLANLAPRSLDVQTTMGGAEIDLRGDWLSDAAIRLSVTMGGIEVRLPEGVDVRGLAAGDHHLESATPEVRRPVLRFSVSENMGEVEVVRR
jgi:hypothetical protein